MSFPDPVKFQSSIEIAKFEASYLAPEDRLIDLADKLPKKLPFPFSGVIAFRIGDNDPIIRAHCPNQAAFKEVQPFNVLSVGKLFTATAVMQLIEDGKLTLQTPLSELLTDEELDVALDPPYLEGKPKPSELDYLRDYLREHPSEITVEHLLSHTAGFHIPKSESEEIPLPVEERGEIWDPKNIGKKDYSNYGYQLLAIIIGKKSNAENYEAGFRAYIEKSIFEPAHMDGASREIPTKIEPPEPYPHGNGCWRMTARELLKFEYAIRHHLLISAQSFQIMKESQPPLGFMVDRDESGSIIGYGHPGSGQGMSSFLHTWQTDPPITAVVLSNYSGCENVKPWLDGIIPSL